MGAQRYVCYAPIKLKVSRKKISEKKVKVYRRFQKWSSIQLRLNSVMSPNFEIMIGLEFLFYGPVRGYGPKSFSMSQSKRRLIGRHYRIYPYVSILSELESKKNYYVYFIICNFQIFLLIKKTTSN